MRLFSRRYLLAATAAIVAAYAVLAPYLGSLISSPLPRIDGARVLAIVVVGFDAPEYGTVKALLEAQGALVVTASFTIDEVVGERGAVKPDISLSEVDLDGYDALFMPGGYYIRANIREDPRREVLYELVRRADAEGKLIGAICRAPAVLGDAGIAAGRRATGYDLDELEALGAIATDAAVVEDGNLLTGSGPAAAGEFAERLVRRLAE